MGFISTFLYSQLLVTLPYPNYDFSGQTIIVTGSNTGLGLEAARHFIRLNAAKVILAVRTISKGEAAAAEISTSTDTPKSRVEVWQLDLSNTDSIKAFAARVDTLDRLDAFVQNAGILTNIFTLVEGQESHIALNVTNAVLLGLLVLPKLRESAARYGSRGRLTFVGSDLQYIAKFKEKEAAAKEAGVSLYDALAVKEFTDMNDRYRVSKLLLLYAVRSMAAKSPVSLKSNVIINYHTPGACHSDIFRDDVGWIQKAFLSVLLAIVARTTEAGSRTLVHAVKPDIGEDTHGAFLMDCKVFPNGENVDSAEGRELQERFTRELFAKLEQISPGVTSI